MNYPVVVPYVRVLEAPPAEPVTLAQAKEWCRVDADDTSQDNILNLVIQGARERAEFLTGYALVRRRLELRLDRFPCDLPYVIELPYPPVASVEYIDYRDLNGALQTLTGSPSNWTEDLGSEPARIQPLPDTYWPDTKIMVGAVHVGYTAGYAPGTGSPTDYAANIPAAIKMWMNARICTYYDRRDQLDLNNVATLPRDFVDGLLDNHRARLGFA